MEASQADARDRLTVLGPAKPAPAAEVDLERLVWDPEYRNAVRHLFSAKG